MIGIIINFELFKLFIEDIAHAATNPIVTIITGLIFNINGRINIVELIGGIHDIAPPAIIDKVDSATIGLIIFICSFILISKGPE